VPICVCHSLLYWLRMWANFKYIWIIFFTYLIDLDGLTVAKSCYCDGLSVAKSANMSSVAK
jgi:hypothetical protein